MVIVRYLRDPFYSRILAENIECLRGKELVIGVTSRGDENDINHQIHKLFSTRELLQYFENILI